MAEVFLDANLLSFDGGTASFGDSGCSFTDIIVSTSPGPGCWASKLALYIEEDRVTSLSVLRGLRSILLSL